MSRLHFVTKFYCALQQIGCMDRAAVASKRDVTSSMRGHDHHADIPHSKTMTALRDGNAKQD